jgi:hypothetical protein
MEGLSIGLIVLVLILLAAIVYLAMKNATVPTGYITAADIPVVTGEFGVQPSVDPSSVTTISECTSDASGAIGTSICLFNNITSLRAAADVCDRYISFCTTFLYSPDTNVMVIVAKPDTWIRSSNTSYDGYIRQYNYVA